MNELATTPWARRTGETTRSFEAFAAYLNQGPNRSLAKTAREGLFQVSSLKRWSTANAWVERAAAYDSAALEHGLGRRRALVEATRQAAIDGAGDHLNQLQAIASGVLPAGDVEAILDRHGAPVRETVQLPDGTTQQVVLTRPAIPPSVRVKSLVELLNLAGIVAPKGTGEDLDQQVAALRAQLGEAVETWPAMILETMHALMTVSVALSTNGQPKTPEDEIAAPILTDVKWRLWDLAVEINPVGASMLAPEYERASEYERVGLTPPKKSEKNP